MLLRPAASLLLACAVVGTAAAARAQEPASGVLFRVFLTDGQTLTSYGEWARVGDRVVFSMPLAPQTPDAELHLVSVPADRVNWDETDRYADAVRAAHYASSRGEADYATLSAEVARVLNEVALTADPAARLEKAERARRALATWPGARYGYRAAEVREIVGLLDEVIADLRAAAGLGRFDLALTAAPTAAPARPLLPPPDRAEVVQQLMTAAELAEAPAARMSLLQTVLGLLDRAIGALPATWAASIRERARRALADEQRIDRAYAGLQAKTLGAAQLYAARADVRALERLRDRVRAEDARLGRHRPDQVVALVETVVSHLESAQRFRLALDQWEMRAGAFREYEKRVSPRVETLQRASGSLEDIRAMAGPDLTLLRALRSTLASDGARLARVAPPADLSAVHAVLRSAWELAESAVRLRLEAVAANSLDQAQRASSAASGALLLLGRARADLAAALQPPRLP